MKFSPGQSHFVPFDRRDAPKLVVFVDAEEEFLWHTYSPTATSVRNISVQHTAQDIFDTFGVKPTYLVDYPVASQPEGFEPLLAMQAAGGCTIGAQLHPWVNPPIEEQINLRNTYAGNLSPGLERAKIERLTEVITANFGRAPRVFKTGRYGAGPHTAAAVAACGYTIDTSVMPLADFSAEGGPDYTAAVAGPYWIDPQENLLELPATVGLVGLFESFGGRGVRALLNDASSAIKFPGLLAHLGLLERIRLTPEGISLNEAKRLTMALLRQGQRLFVISYHSSSLLVGGNPYAATGADVANILSWLNGYMRFFFGPLGGEATTAEFVHAAARTKPGIGSAKR